MIVAGKYCGNDGEDDVLQLAHKAGLSDRVVLPGFLGPADMIGLLSGSDVVTSPSLDVPFNAAAFPTKIAEYAGIGCCIVATRVGDIPVYFQDNYNARLVVPDSPESMAAAFVELSASPEVRARLGASAAETAKVNFDYQEHGRKLDEAIRDHLQHRRAA